jgi:hypothetical protein
MPNEYDRPNLSARLPRFQFTIRSMLILTAIVAVLCSILFAMPDWAADLFLFFLAMFIPAILVTLLVYGTRNQRTFGVGALFPTGFLLLVALNICTVRVPDFDTFLPSSANYHGRLTVALFWMLGALNGYLCVLTRRWIEKHRETEEDGKPTEM